MKIEKLCMTAKDLNSSLDLIIELSDFEILVSETEVQNIECKCGNDRPGFEYIKIRGNKLIKYVVTACNCGK